MSDLFAVVYVRRQMVDCRDFRPFVKAELMISWWSSFTAACAIVFGSGGVGSVV